jgi:zinc/manganese transport system substrate-binding protein
MHPNRFRFALAFVAIGAIFVLAGCSATTPSSNGKIVAVGAENQYADVISQIGGKYVSVSSIMSNPNTDPHTFEASADVAREVSTAQIVVQNGLGYDQFMNKLESASTNPGRNVIVAQDVLHLADSTANPHLWYSTKTMPAVASEIEKALVKIRPSDAAYFKARLTQFNDSLKPWMTALATFKSRHPGAAVAVTEPVADYALQVAGADNLTPFALQASVMNGTDPSPQDVTTQNGLFTGHRVKAFLYNRQVTEATTAAFLKLAIASHIPVVAVYETMPTDGYTYQSWMLAEVRALTSAVEDGKSTNRL